MTVHVGQPEVAAGIAVGEPRVVETEQVEHRGVQVMHRERFVYRGEAEFVGRAVAQTAADAGAGEKVYRSHELTYAGDLIRCKHCGHTVTGESVVKKTTGKEYVSYRCSLYNTPGHPRVRLSEEKLDRQLLTILDKMRIESDDCREWFARQLRQRTKTEQEEARLKAEEVQRQLSLLRQQQDRLVNLRLLGEIDDRTLTDKATELRDQEANLMLQLAACDVGRHENNEIAIKAFELSQSLRVKWLTADYAAKRRLLEIVFLNFVLDDVTLVPETRTPFDALAEGFVSENSRGDKTPLELFRAGVQGLPATIRAMLCQAATG